MRFIEPRESQSLRCPAPEINGWIKIYADRQGTVIKGTRRITRIDEDDHTDGWGYHRSPGWCMSISRREVLASVLGAGGIAVASERTADGQSNQADLEAARKALEPRVLSGSDLASALTGSLETACRLGHRSCALTGNGLPRSSSLRSAEPRSPHADIGFQDLQPPMAHARGQLGRCWLAEVCLTPPLAGDPRP